MNIVAIMPIKMKNERRKQMLRRQFTNLLAERAGLKKWQAEEFIKAFPEVLAEVLLQEKKQTLIGFGSFELKDIPARKLERRLLGETYELDSYKRVCFKASDPLYEMVNGSKRNEKVKKTGDAQK